MGYASESDSENVSSCFQNEHNAETLTQKEKKHKCTHLDCHAVFLRPSKLKRHMRQHTGEKPFACNEPGCTKTYSSSCHLKRHMKTHDLIQAVYKCPQCLQMFGNLSNLKRHYKEQHGKDNVFCGDCGAMFHKKYQLVKHRNTTHLKPLVYKCDICAKNFMDNNIFKRHIKSHEKTYPCPVPGCSEVFDKWSLLRKHKGKHVTEYKCDKCNKILHTKFRLKSHSKIHSEERMVLLCPYEKCQKTYFYKSNLTQHVKTTHLGKRYYCDICSAGLTVKKKLIQHIERHYEPKKNTIRKKYKKRKDAGIPKKSIIGKLIGWDFPHNIEKLLLDRDTAIKISESDKSSNDVQIESVENIHNN